MTVFVATRAAAVRALHDALSAATGEEEPCARCTGEGMVEASEVEG